MCGTTDKKWNDFLNIKGPVSIWTVLIHCLPRHTACAMASLAAFKPERYRNTSSAVMIVRAVIHQGTREIYLNKNLLSLSLHYLTMTLPQHSFFTQLCALPLFCSITGVNTEE